MTYELANRIAKAVAIVAGTILVGMALYSVTSPDTTVESATAIAEPELVCSSLDRERNYCFLPKNDGNDEDRYKVAEAKAFVVRSAELKFKAEQFCGKGNTSQLVLAFTCTDYAKVPNENL